jgi:REP element-mobilizing transposase RayT
MSKLPVRKSVRLGRLNYVGQKFYFLTLCCFHRQTAFLNPKPFQWLLSLLRAESANNLFIVHAYCLMPDHLHFLGGGYRTEQ